MRYTGLCWKMSQIMSKALRMYSSPALWPRVSLIFFSPFTSQTTTAKGSAFPASMAWLISFSRCR